jgi:hypothetical protein
MARRPLTTPPPAPPMRSFPDDDDASDEERWGSGATWHLLDAVDDLLQDDEIDPLPIPRHPTAPPDETMGAGARRDAAARRVAGDAGCASLRPCSSRIVIRMSVRLASGSWR